MTLYTILYCTLLVFYPNNTGALPHQPIHIRQLHWRIALEVQWEVRKTLSGSMLIIDMQCNPIKTKAMVWKTSARRVEKHEVLNTAHQATVLYKIWKIIPCYTITQCVTKSMSASSTNHKNATAVAESLVRCDPGSPRGWEPGSYEVSHGWYTVLHCKHKTDPTFGDPIIAQLENGGGEKAGSILRQHRNVFEGEWRAKSCFRSGRRALVFS